MQKQGKILRDCANGNGLISSQGEKWEFNLETHWKSDNPPQTGGGVNFVVDDNNQLVSVEAIDSRAELEQKLRNFGGKLKTDGLPVAQNLGQGLLTHVGIPKLVLFTLLFITWYGFNGLKLGDVGMNFFDVLAIVNKSPETIQNGTGGSSGLYGVLAWISLLAIFLPVVWKSRIAHLGSVLPLVIHLIAFIGYRFSIRSHFNNINNEFLRGMVDGVLENISFGFGFYVSLLLCLACAAFAVWDYLTKPV
ncbi:hypothetical protein AGMMS50225_04430 [Betaproteobacteria bacterium]|nr:hypothetical protein AGMMS50225_04430 [Betaproteobacteria bacterium]